jgi:hypothetical protein
MSKLCEPIKGAIATALDLAGDDADKCAEIYEALCSGLAMCISVGARGDPKTMNNLCEGASNYIMERACELQKFGAFMAAISDEKRK